MVWVWQAVAGLGFAIWIYLLIFRGGFWRSDQRLAGLGPPAAGWPAVAVVVPARDESAVIGRSIASLLAQDYPGPFRIVLVDDHSSDGTRDLAQAAAAGDSGDRLTVLAGAPLPPGWSGKLWALSQGVVRAQAELAETRYLLLTDADIHHPAGSLRRLVAKAEGDQLALTSLMVRLDAGGFWGGLLIPAFIFFFQKLYPFPWVNHPERRTAAAAGGCVLVRRDALAGIGGLAAIRGALIDDCTLAARIKARGGRLWLGLDDGLVSLRPYGGFAGIWDMVARTAYTQLNHSPLLLAGAVLGMAATYLAAPVAVLAWPWSGDGTAAALGLGGWFLCSLAWRPTLKLYRVPVVVGYLLPVAGLLYSLMTVASALRHWRGHGGRWKGRVYSGSAHTGMVQRGQEG